MVEGVLFWMKYPFKSLNLTITKKMICALKYDLENVYSAKI